MKSILDKVNEIFEQMTSTTTTSTVTQPQLTPQQLKSKITTNDAVEIQNLPAGDPGAKYNKQVGRVVDVDKNNNSVLVKFKDNQLYRFNQVNPYLKKKPVEPVRDQSAVTKLAKANTMVKPGQLSIA